nr:MAG TPA: hypothetical protein [Caudoviricetes sp.]
MHPGSVFHITPPWVTKNVNNSKTFQTILFGFLYLFAKHQLNEKLSGSQISARLGLTVIRN